MLSIIISSYKQHYFDALVENINNTIGEGVIFEMIQIWNPGTMGLCEAYNSGAEKAKYENLLFIHEDILFQTQNWGIELIKALQLPDCGVIGVAGNPYYSFVPASWWNSKYDKSHYIQTFSPENSVFNDKVNFSPRNENEEVKALDGVFLACKKSVYDDIRFDESISGFHGYDLIFSLKSAKKYKNYVVSSILINHFSKGTFSLEWLQAILKVRKIIGTFPNQINDRDIEIENFEKLLNHFNKYKFPKMKAFKIILKYSNPKILGYKNVFKILNLSKYLFI